jgi:hypothetical protein
MVTGATGILFSSLAKEIKAGDLGTHRLMRWSSIETPIFATKTTTFTTAPPRTARRRYLVDGK